MKVVSLKEEIVFWVDILKELDGERKKVSESKAVSEFNDFFMMESYVRDVSKIIAELGNTMISVRKLVDSLVWKAIRLGVAKEQSVSLEDVKRDMVYTEHFGVYVGEDVVIVKERVNGVGVSRTFVI